MALPFASQSSNQQVYATGISSLLNQVILYDPDFGLEQDPEFYEKVLRDSACGSSIDYLSKLIVGHDWFVEPTSDEESDRKVASAVEELQRETTGLAQAWYNLSAAVWKGAAWGLIELETRTLKIGDGKPREWVVVARVRDVDKRRFRLTRIPVQPIAATPESRVGGRIPPASHAFTRDWHWEINKGAWTDLGPGWWTPLQTVAPLERWVQHITDNSERGMAYGYGLAGDLYFNVFAKTKVMRSLLQGIDRFGQGFLFQKVKQLRDASPSGLSPEAKIQRVVNTLKTFRSENVYAIDSEDDLDILDAPADALKQCLELVTYFDNENRIRILSALHTTGGGGESGSYAKAKVEEGSTDANVSFLRSPLEETWTHRVLRLLVKHNRANLEELGAEGEIVTPRLRLRGRATLDPDKASRLLTVARGLNMPVLEREAYSMMELTTPKPGDKTLDWTLPEAGGPGGTPGGAPGNEAGGKQVRQGGGKFGGTTAQPKAPKTETEKPTGTGGRSLGDTGGDKKENFAANRERREMPQIPEARLHEFLAWVRMQGVIVDEETMSVDLLGGSQSELNRAKIDRLVGLGLDQLLTKPLLGAAAAPGMVGADLLDGHHRKAAIEELDPDAIVHVFVIGLPIAEAIELAHEFPGAVVKGIRDGAVEKQRAYIEALRTTLREAVKNAR